MSRYYREEDLIECARTTWCDMYDLDDFLAEVPTADVVPKSEVERAYQRGFERGKRDNVCGFSAEDIAQKAENIAIDLEAMRTAANSYKMHYENARAEVAREIFEEIEQWLGNYNGCRVITYEKFDELKKKYTEENK